MCGIAAAFAPAGTTQVEALREYADRLAAALAHRGPDDVGYWDDGRYCALAHRRLAVIDLTPGGHQPMQYADGRFHVSYNGEIYNFGALRAELESLGHAFRSRSDTEVLLAAYAQWGAQAFARLDGMFALALYDASERRLVLARDRAGEKPLYYARLGDVLVAASGLRAIAGLPTVRSELDPRALFDYLALRYVPAPRTILQGILQLEPATALSIGADGSEQRIPFHAFDRVVDPPPVPAAELADRLESALVGSLERRLVADVPVGAFLSSGIDSSLVCALAARKLRRELRTFCAGFAGAADDETSASRRIAATLGLPHREYVISSDDLLGVASGFGALLDEPNGDRSCVPVHLLAREMRREVTVAISGDGGDELFCGYGRYFGFDEALQRRQPASALAALELYFEHALPVFSPSALSTLFPDEHAAWREEFLALYGTVTQRSGWNGAQRLSVLDYHTYLPGAVLSKVDRMAMRHALEVRTPFLEPGVMEIAAALPSDLCSAGKQLKPLLRQLLARHLDPGLVATRKIGFGMPQAFIEAHRARFDAMLRAACESLRATQFFRARPGALDRLAALAPANVNSQWALTVLGMWADAIGLTRAG